MPTRHRNGVALNRPTRPVAKTPPVIQWLKDILSLITLLSATLAALGAFTAVIKSKFPFLNNIGQPYLLLVSFVLSAVTALLQRKRLYRRSELKKPEVLRLDPRNTEHLTGRDEDIKRLLAHLNQNALVWLSGESGVGKSALLEGGLLPGLRRDPSKFALYLNSYGEDWTKGPFEALAESLRELGSSSRSSKRISTITADNAINKLKEVKDSGRFPILLFDQFDDYQIRHRERFFPGGNSLISAQTLANQNPFWQQICDLLKDGAIRCLFATRDSFSLDCVRFAEPKSYPPLDRLRREDVLSLLSRLTHTDVVVAPDNGWEQLKRQLAQDLAAEGNVLPIQMKVAFRGLQGLPSLTLGDYQGAGGLLGLEVLHIAYHVLETARHSGLEEGEVLTVLLAMVDRDSGNTVPITWDLLLAKFKDSERYSPKIQKALENLEEKELVRKQLDYDRGSFVWVLDHRYLSRGILHLERQSQYWAHSLQDAVAAFQAAGNPWTKWKALLGPWLQLRILYQRLRGRLVYGNSRTFALWSMTRLVVNVPVLLLCLFAYAFEYSHVHTEANKLFSEIGVGGSLSRPSSREAQALWGLSTASYRVRRQVLDDVVSQEAEADRFLSRWYGVTVAVAGLDPTSRANLTHDILARCYARSWDPEAKTAWACANLIAALDPGSKQATQFVLDVLKTGECEETGITSAHEHLFSGLGQPDDTVAKGAVSAFISALDSGPNDDLQCVDVGLQELVRRLPNSQASYAFHQLLEAWMKTSRNTERSKVLAQALRGVAYKLDPDHAPEAFNQFLKALREAADSPKPNQSQLPRPSPHERPTAARVYDPTEPNAFAAGAAALASKLGESEARAAIVQLLPTISSVSDPSQLNSLTIALANAASKLNEADAQTTFAELMSSWRSSSDQDRSNAYLVGTIGVAPRLGAANRAALVQQLIRDMGQTKLPVMRSFLAAVIAKLPGSPGHAESQAVVKRLLEALDKSSDSGQVAKIEAAFTAFADKLNETEALAAAAQIRAAIGKSQDQTKVGCLIAGYSAAASRIATNDAPRLFDQLLSDLQDYRYRYMLRPLGEGLTAVAAKLGETKAAQASARLATMIPEVSDPETVGYLANALGAMSSTLDPPSITAVLDHMVKLIDDDSSGSGADALRSGFLSFTKKLTKTQTLELYNRLLGSFGEASSSWPRSILGDALEVLGGRLAEKDVPQVLDHAIDVLLSEPEIPCATFVSLTNSTTLPKIIEVLKWPTCQHQLGFTRIESQLIEKIAQVKGIKPETFGMYEGKVYFADRWKFADWAEKEGLNVKGAPSRRPTFGP